MAELTPRQVDALNRIEAKPELQQFFFRKIKGLFWFDALEARGYFNPRHNPEPVETKDNLFMIPSWPILDYLERTAPELEAPANRDYSRRYLNIMRAATEDSMRREISNHRTWWYFAKLLCHIHVEDIADADIEQADYWLKDRFDRSLVGTELGERLLPRLLAVDSEQSRPLVLCLLRVLTQIIWLTEGDGPSKRGDARLPMDSYHAGKIFSAHAGPIGEKLEVGGLRIFHERLAEVLSRSDRGSYSAIWRPAIEDHEQNISPDEAEQILISAYRDALLGFVGRRAAEATDYLRSLLRDEQVIFQRIAIFVVSQFHRRLLDLLPEILVPDFLNANCRHEMYQLLRASFSHLEPEAKDRVLAAISEVSEESFDSDQSEEIQQKQRSYEALRWLSAIRGQSYDPADARYAEHLAATGTEPEHPDFSSYMTSGWVGERSAFTAQDLLSREPGDLIQLLSTYQEKPGWREPTRRGLALELKAAVIASPDRFRGRLLEFASLDLDYVTEILDAHKELWTKSSYDDWSELLDFSSVLLAREGFWEPIDRTGLEPMMADRGWVVGSIADLLKAGTASDENAFHPDLLPRAGEILSVMLVRQEGSEHFRGGRDAQTTAINSPRGKCIAALVNYSLRCCRLADKADNSHLSIWEERLQPMFDREVVAADEGNFEFATLFGSYILNFLYLSTPWTKAQLPRIFDKSKHLKWLCAMSGYSYVDRVHPDIYDFLQADGHIVAALDAEEIEQSGKGRFVDNVVIAYLRGNERLDDDASTLCQILRRRRYEELHHLIWFIWTMRDGERPSFEDQILPLWSRLSDGLDQEDEGDRRILSSMCMWTAYADEIAGPVRELLLKASPHADVDHNAYIMVSELRRLVENSPVAVAEIYLQMLSEFAPTYEQEEIEATIEALYESGGEARAMANSICDRYLERGVEFPARIRERYAIG